MLHAPIKNMGWHTHKWEVQQDFRPCHMTHGECFLREALRFKMQQPDHRIAPCFFAECHVWHCIIPSVICAEQIKWISISAALVQEGVVLGSSTFHCCFSPPSTPSTSYATPTAKEADGTFASQRQKDVWSCCERRSRKNYIIPLFIAGSVVCIYVYFCPYLFIVIDEMKLNQVLLDTMPDRMPNRCSIECHVEC